MGRREMDQPVAPLFFRAYAGSGLVIQPCARCQRTPRRLRVAQIVSPVTRSSVIPSLTQTAATQIERPEARRLVESARRLVDERTQPFARPRRRRRWRSVRAGRAFGQGVQSAPVEGMDGIAHRLIVAAEGNGDPPGTLLPGGSEEDLATPQREGIGGAQPGSQCVAFAVRKGRTKIGGFMDERIPHLL